MTTLTEKELMSLNGEEKQDASFATVTADNFVGHLTGVADNAKRLYESQRLVLQGDVSGATDIGQGNTSIDVTVNHAKNADVATSCGYATDSLNASHADLANIATFAHTADKAVDAEHAKESDHSKETDHSLLADNATNANHADVSSEANHATDSDHAILSDTATVALKDNKDRELDKTIDDIIAKELADTTALQSAIDDTNNVINNEVKVKLDDHEQRLSNLETTTDIGKLNERIVKIEELNEQQDSRLDSIDTLNAEQNTRLDNVESLANSTATTVTENKNAVDTQINNLKLEDTALSNRITNLDTTHKQDIDRLDNSDTNLQEQIDDLRNRATGHDTSLGKLFTDLATTNNTIKEQITDIKNDYLSLAGGQMTGATIASSINDSMLVLAGGTDTDNGASFTANGKDNSNGSFIARANNGNTSAVLIGESNGTLKWNDKNLVRSVNGVKADTSGNVTIDTSSNKTPCLYIATDNLMETSPVAHGDITLSQSWRSFDALLVMVANDSIGWLESRVLDVKAFDKAISIMKALATGAGQKGVGLGSFSGTYWLIDSYTTTSYTFPLLRESDCAIHSIYGCYYRMH